MIIRVIIRMIVRVMMEMDMMITIWMKNHGVQLIREMVRRFLKRSKKPLIIPNVTVKFTFMSGIGGDWEL